MAVRAVKLRVLCRVVVGVVLATPLLLAGPARAGRCPRGNLTALAVHERARDDLREFYWSNTARFFERSRAGVAPRAIHDRHAPLGWMSLEAALEEAGVGQRDAFVELAGAPAVDLADPAVLQDVANLFLGLEAEQVAALLRAEAPTLRAHLWSWLATTRAGGCVLASLPVEFVEASVAERSLVVELADEFRFRPVGDYALAARARMIAGAPGSLDQFLGRVADTTLVVGQPRYHPLVKAAAHAILIRRGHRERYAAGLADPSPDVRAATALALLDVDHAAFERAVVEHAAADPDDRVTEVLVGRALERRGALIKDRAGVVIHGPLAELDDPRLSAAIARWLHRGDPLAPLPTPRPRRPAPAPQDMSIPTPAPTPATAIAEPVSYEPEASATIDASATLEADRDDAAAEPEADDADADDAADDAADDDATASDADEGLPGIEPE